MRRTSYLAVLAACVCCTVVRAQATDFDKKQVNLQANASGLADVFSDLARQSGAPIILKGGEKLRATLALTNIPFADGVNALSDMFALLATWRDKTLVVQSMDEALAEAARQLAQGRVEAVVALAGLASGAQPMYGSPKLKARLKDALTALIRDRTAAVLQGAQTPPALAVALASLEEQDPAARTALGAVAVRELARVGQAEQALAVWNQYVQDANAPDASIAWGELLLALHYTGCPQAAGFWGRTFTPELTNLILRQGWQQRDYLEALHFARLNAQYARAAGRADDAGCVERAISSYLDAPRVIQVTCLVDNEATTDPQCETKVRARIAKCSEVFQQAFGIKFEITEMLRWSPPATSDFDQQLAAVKAALGARRPELTIGFILQVYNMHPADFDPSHRHLWTGFGCPHMGAYLLTRDFAFDYATDRASVEWTFTAGAVAETLVHEMGHMFGALHVDREPSVMRPSSPGAPNFNFDPVNARIIKCEKWKDFTRGTDSLDEPELLALAQNYRELLPKCSVSNGANEEEARVHLALAKLYRLRRSPQRAAEQAQWVVAIGAPPEIVTQARQMLAAG